MASSCIKDKIQLLGVASVDFKDKTVILPAKWVYSGKAKIAIQDKKAIEKAINKSNKEKRGMSFYGEKGGWEGLF